jgi:thiamine pyrophosphate-dependent acetolactate synthase large subunit-like protein
LMGVGSLATIGVKQPKNLAIVVLDNAHYGATGMQPSHTKAGVDLATVAKGCRFQRVAEVSELERAAEMRALLHNSEGPTFILARVAADDPPRVYPSLDGHATKYRFMRASAKPA